MSLGIVYVVTEYGIEWTVCEGPSMMPTIKPRGEIVIIDRFTPQLFGLRGGDTIAKRTEFARRSQENHVENRKRTKKKEREWLLRLYQQEEEKLLQRNHQQQEEIIMNKLETSEETESTQQSPPTMFPDSNSKHALLEQGSQSQSPSSNQTSSSNVEILRALREDLERLGDNDDDDDETWYETRIPVNKLPPEEAWDRFRRQISTGISVGDVVVLQHPDRIGTVCKRVMGLPGDIVTKPSSRIGSNRLEDMLHGRRRAAALRQTSEAGDTTFPLFLETEQERLRRNNRNKRRLLSSGLQVPDGHIWVEGDNPWNSSDSRNYGTVPASLIMGRVLLRLWPIRGGALMERGDRPVRSDEDELSMAFSGSIIVPVGWDDQKIVREFVPVTAAAEPPTMAEPKSVERQHQKKQ
jgi:signal peptidase I